MTLVGHETRIRILDQLRQEERNVLGITDVLHTTQQNVTGRLRLLLIGGFVARRVAGREVYYAIADDSVFDAWAVLLRDKGRHRGELTVAW